MTQTITETPVYVFRDWEEQRRYEAMTEEVREEYEKEHGVPIGPLPDIMGPADPQNEAGSSQLPTEPTISSIKKGKERERAKKAKVSERETTSSSPIRSAKEYAANGTSKTLLQRNRM